jgi:hypothetical protein
MLREKWEKFKAEHDPMAANEGAWRQGIAAVIEEIISRTEQGATAAPAAPEPAPRLLDEAPALAGLVHEAQRAASALELIALSPQALEVVQQARPVVEQLGQVEGLPEVARPLLASLQRLFGLAPAPATPSPPVGAAPAPASSPEAKVLEFPPAPSSPEAKAGADLEAEVLAFSRRHGGTA